MWFYIAISAALVSGISVILSKQTLSKVGPAVLYWASLAISTPLIAFFAFKNGIPNLSGIFFIGALGSIIFYTFSRILQFRVIRDAPLSHVYPLIALSPISTLILAFLPPISERPSALSLLGVLISLVGTYILNISSVREGLFEPFKILFRNKFAFLMLISVVTLGFVNAFDKIAIKGTDPQNTIFALFFENIVIVFGMLPYFIPKLKDVFSQISMNKWPLLSLGVLAAISNSLGFISIGNGNVGIVSALFRTQIFFALLFSFLLFKDKPKFETIIGSIIMISGVVLIKIGL